MTDRKVVKLHLINTGQLNDFLGREKTRINIPECILEEYHINNWFELNSEGLEVTPLRQYKAVEGFEFNWGHILERRAEQYVVWDFCFSQLLKLYLKNDMGLGDLQRDTFYHLERKVECCTRDMISVLSKDKWKIVPCSSVGVFSLVLNFTDEQDARQWAVENLINDTVPSIIRKLQNNVGNNKK